MAEKKRSIAKKDIFFALDTKIEPSIGSLDHFNVVVNANVVPMDIVKGTRGYIEDIANQANGSYQFGWFDACAVMIRRLIETLIIECFECHKIDSKIKDSNGNYIFLQKLIDACLNENTWTLGRNTKKALSKLKEIGDLSAHGRRYLATKSDINKISEGLRLAVEELIYLSDLKR